MYKCVTQEISCVRRSHRRLLVCIKLKKIDFEWIDCKNHVDNRHPELKFVMMQVHNIRKYELMPILFYYDGTNSH